MTQIPIILNFEEFKKKFNNHILDRKKIRALENIIETGICPFPRRLKLIKSCFEEGFLEPEEHELLDLMIKKMNVDYLTWAYKTKWVKSQLKYLKDAQHLKNIQLQLNLEFETSKPVPKINIPLHLIRQNSYNAYTYQ